MAQSKEEQIKMYGCELEPFMESVKDSMTDPLMAAMSIMSDAQEEIARGLDERARQGLNRAKYLISQEYRAKRAAGLA